MMIEQILFAIWAAPATSLLLLLFGRYLQNTNNNVLRKEFREDMNTLRSDLYLGISTEAAAFRDIMRAELSALRAELEAIRAEMSKNQSELLGRIAGHEHRHH